MALLTFSQEATESKKPPPPSKRKRKISKQQKQPSSWDQIKNLLTCKQIEGSRVHDPSKSAVGYSKLGSSCSSICSFRDVVHGNTRVVHRADNSPESSTVGQESGLLSRKTETRSSSTRSLSGSARSNHGGASFSSSSRAMQFRKLSGCYECHMIVDPSRYICIIGFNFFCYLILFFFPKKLVHFDLTLQLNERDENYQVPSCKEYHLRMLSVW